MSDRNDFRSAKGSAGVRAPEDSGAASGPAYVRDILLEDVIMASFTPNSIMDAPSGMVETAFSTPRLADGKPMFEEEPPDHGIPIGFLGGFVPEASFIR